MGQPRQVTVIGCGVVGAMIAYELSLLDPVEVTVIDRQRPAQAATGAALGVLMGIISHKVKGRNWQLRQSSLERYQSLIPELEAQIQRPLPYNNQGILSLCFEAEQLPRWQSLQAIRQAQGYPLEIWTPDQLLRRCPDIDAEGVVAAIYSPQDGQMEPTAFTQACIEAAANRGVKFRFDQPVTGLAIANGHCVEVHTADTSYSTDAVVLAAGLGTSALADQLQQAVPLVPVLGQAVRLKLERPVNHPDFQPVINGRDVHLVPLGNGEYWVGATVEFPDGACPPQPDITALDQVVQGAIAYCPTLAAGTVIDSWSGLRPRPQGQAAPIISPLSGFDNILIASGHYRNGVLLAPATALAVADWVLKAILANSAT